MDRRRRGGHGQGIGRRLLAATEQRAAAAGAATIYADTSGRADYARTRAFYHRAGYLKAAELPDFYAPGEAKVIFAKRLSLYRRLAKADYPRVRSPSAGFLGPPYGPLCDLK